MTQLYGLCNGSDSGSSVKNIVINVAGGSVGDIRGGNSSAGKVPGEFRADSVQINLTGGEVTGKLYGGSQLNAGRIAVVVDGASAKDIYAGSKYGTVGNTSVEVKSARFPAAFTAAAPADRRLLVIRLSTMQKLSSPAAR